MMSRDEILQRWFHQFTGQLFIHVKEVQADDGE